MNEGFPYGPIVAAIIQGSRVAEENLHRQLYEYYILQSANDKFSKEDLKAVFPDAFQVFLGRLRRKHTNPDSFQKANIGSWLHGYFESAIESVFFNCDRSAYHIIQGVLNNNMQAEQHLFKRLHDRWNINYTAGLMKQFSISAMEPGDFVADAIAEMIGLIRSEKFTLEPTEPNELNKNRLFKYFRRIILNKVGKWKEAMKKDSTLHESIKMQSDDHVSSAEHLVTGQESKALNWKMLELVDALGEACKKLLRELYLKGTSPKNIVKAQIIPALNNAEAVHKRKDECLSRLHRDFIQKVESLDSQLVLQIAHTSQIVVQEMEEPCRSILMHFLWPPRKTMDEIANMLQTTLPASLVANLKTADQVKRRKYKCLNALHNQLWDTILKQN